MLGTLVVSLMFSAGFLYDRQSFWVWFLVSSLVCMLFWNTCYLQNGFCFWYMFDKTKQVIEDIFADEDSGSKLYESSTDIIPSIHPLPFLIRRVSVFLNIMKTLQEPCSWRSLEGNLSCPYALVSSSVGNPLFWGKPPLSEV